MKKADRIKRANRRIIEDRPHKHILLQTQKAGQQELARELARLCEGLKQKYPGIWHTVTLDDLATLAEELSTVTDKGYAPRIQMWWQPRLGGITDDITGHAFPGSLGAETD